MGFFRGKYKYMYGMIHKGSRYAVIKIFGEAAWSKSLALSGLSEEHFISAAHYDDIMTYSLIEAISIECKITINEVLKAAGRHWIEYGMKAGYGSIHALTGRTLIEFIENLDRMHESLKRTLPKAVLPTFQLISAEPDRIEVIYRSERDGFDTFVCGVLEGVTEYFNVQMDIDYKVTGTGTHFTLKRVENSISLQEMPLNTLKVAV